MKAKVLTVHWHQEDQPIYSAHFQPIGPTIGPPGTDLSARLATAGGDNNIRIWRLQYGGGIVTGVQYLATLAKHSQAVNVVRFDPKGTTLASASDDGTVLLWALQDVKSGNSYTNSKYDGTDESDLEIWKLRHACRGGGQSSSEVYDLAWSPDSQYIIAGQVNNVARIYNASNGQCIRELVEHSHYVQGVAWDPLNEYLATQSSDRSVHIYTLRTKEGKYTLNNSSYKISTPFKISKAELPMVRKLEVEIGGGSGNSSSSSIATNSSFGSSSSNSTTSSASISSTITYPTASTPSATTYSTASPPDTPRSTGSMNPPPVSASRTHSRKSSFSSLNRPESPSPVFPLPAVRQIGSPIIPAASLAGSISTSLNLNANTGSTGTSPNLPTAQLAATGNSATSGTAVSSAGSSPSTPLTRSGMLYHNETFTSFFRRLTFSPDGSLLFTPSGLFKYTVRPTLDGISTTTATPTVNASLEETTNTVYIYTRAGFNRPPVAHLPGLNKPSLAVKCSPVLYKLRDSSSQFSTTQRIDLTKEGESSADHLPNESNSASSHHHVDPSNHLGSPVFNLKYRIIYAVATQDAVIVYDTQQKHPLCIASNLHYATFTDLAWSPDGNTLLMTSTDGFCSTLSFENGELGEVYSPATHLLGESTNTHAVCENTPLPSTTGIITNTTAPSVAPTTTSASSSSPLATGASLIPVISHVPSISVTGSPCSSSIATPPADLPVPVLSTASSPPAKRPAPPSIPTPTAPTSNSTSSKKQRRIAPTLISDSTP